MSHQQGDKNVSRQRMLQHLRTKCDQLHHRLTALADSDPRVAQVAAQAADAVPKLPHKFRVGVLGPTGAGKSTLLNALMGLDVAVLPEGVGGTTSAPAYIECNMDTPALSITVRFHDETEFRNLISKYQDAVKGVKGKETAEGVPVSDIIAILDHAYPHRKGDNLGVMNRNVSCLLGRPVQRTHEMTPEGLESARQFLANLTCWSKEAHEELPSYLVSSVTIVGPFPRIPEGVQLVDLPGLADANEMRSDVAIGSLVAVDAVMLVATSESFAKTAFQMSLKLCSTHKKHDACLVVTRAGMYTVDALEDTIAREGGVGLDHQRSLPAAAALLAQIRWTKLMGNNLYAQNLEQPRTLERPPAFAINFKKRRKGITYPCPIVSREFSLDPMVSWLERFGATFEQQLLARVREFNALLTGLENGSTPPDVVARLTQALADTTLDKELGEVSDIVQRCRYALDEFFVDHKEEVARRVVEENKWDKLHPSTLRVVQREHGSWWGQGSVNPSLIHWNRDVVEESRLTMTELFEDIDNLVLKQAHTICDRLEGILGDRIPNAKSVVDEARQVASELHRLRPSMKHDTDRKLLVLLHGSDARGRLHKEGWLCRLYSHTHGSPAVRMPYVNQADLSVIRMDAIWDVVGKAIRSACYFLLDTEAAHARETLAWFWKRITAAHTLTLTLEAETRSILRKTIENLHIDIVNVSSPTLIARPIRVESEEPSYLICPLSGEVYVNPVRCSPSGQVYERGAIVSALERDPNSPLVEQPVTLSDLVPARDVAALVREFHERQDGDVPDMHAVVRRLSAFNPPLQWHRVPRDGDCLFHSVALILGEGHAELIRHQVGEYLRLHGNAIEVLQLLLAEEDRSLEDYCKWIEKDGSPGGDAELQVVAELYHRRIILVQPDPGVEGGVLVHPLCGESRDDPLVLVHDGHGHFDATVRRDDPTVETPRTPVVDLTGQLQEIGDKADAKAAPEPQPKEDIGGLSTAQLRERYTTQWSQSDSAFARVYGVRWAQYIGIWLRGLDKGARVEQVEDAVRRWLLEEQKAADVWTGIPCVEDETDSTEEDGDNKIVDRPFVPTRITTKTTQVELQVLAFNIGGQDYKHLATPGAIVQLLRDHAPDLVALTEVSSVGAAHAIIRAALPCGWDGDYSWIGRSSNSFVLLWKRSKFRQRGHHEVSHVGRFVLVELCMLGTLSAFKFLACHLPHKHGRPAAATVLRQFFQAAGNVVAAGDFNISKPQIVLTLGVQQADVAIPDHMATTPKSRSIDNVVATGTLRPVVDGYNVLQQPAVSDHYAVLAKVSFNVHIHE